VTGSRRIRTAFPEARKGTRAPTTRETLAEPVGDRNIMQAILRSEAPYWRRKASAPMNDSADECVSFESIEIESAPGFSGSSP
jgi:hypothetical protein